MVKFSHILFAALAMLSLQTTTAWADIDSEGSGGFDPPTVSNETVGTLPTYWTEEEYPLFSADGQDPHTQMLAGLSTEFHVPVGMEKLLIEGAAGQGLALLGPGGWNHSGQELLRVRIYGKVRLQLDETLACDSSVKISAGLGLGLSNAWIYSTIGGQLFQLTHTSIVGQAFALNLSNPTVKTLLENQDYLLTAKAPQTPPASLWMTIQGGKVRIRMDS